MKKLLLSFSIIACSSSLIAESSTPKKRCHLYSPLRRQMMEKLNNLRRNADNPHIDNKFAAALALGVITYECQNGRKVSPEDHGAATTDLLRRYELLDKAGFIYREICECLVAEPAEECQL